MLGVVRHKGKVQKQHLISQKATEAKRRQRIGSRGATAEKILPRRSKQQQRQWEISFCIRDNTWFSHEPFELANIMVDLLGIS